MLLNEEESGTVEYGEVLSYSVDPTNDGKEMILVLLFLNLILVL